MYVIAVIIKKAGHIVNSLATCGILFVDASTAIGCGAHTEGRCSCGEERVRVLTALEGEVVYSTTIVLGSKYSRCARGSDGEYLGMMGG